MSELALDLGIKMGYCIRTGFGKFEYGLVNLDAGSKRTKYDKLKQLDDWLILISKTLEEKGTPLGIVYYEKVDFSYHTYSTQAHGAYVGIVRLFCQKKGIMCEGFSVSKIKKSLTGRGNASKMGMVYHAEKYVNETINNDNIADAIGVMYTARKGRR